MPSLLTRDLPDDLHQKLKERAARNSRSLAKETLVILEAVLRDTSGKETPELPVPYKGCFQLTGEWIDQAKCQGRA